jgi:hypothetical protein
MLRNHPQDQRVTREEEHEVHPTRRNFIRRAGIIGGITAAVIGAADLAGMSSAVAAVGVKGQRNASGAEPCCFSCTFDPGHCNNGAACASGSCCFHCVGSCGSEYTQCLSRPNCDKFGYCL